MQSEFQTYWQLGLRHISDPNGYDHIVFLVALCLPYSLREVKHVALLATAFTLGHSLTLGLAALGVISPPSALIELLIPVSIIVTSIFQIRHNNNAMPNSYAAYTMALLFGLLHGMGFSSYFKSLLGESESIITPLFAFNIGIETGQLAIVLLFLSIATAILRYTQLARRDWQLLLAGACIGISLTLLLVKFV